MKKFYSFLATALLSAGLFAQVTIYSENMGTATATTPIASNVFQNGAPITYSGTADIRATSSSSPSDYAGASGGANVLVNAIDEYFLISGINTSGYEDLVLSLGQRKGANAANNELKIEVSNDGSTWTALSYTRETGSGTSNWKLITPTGTIPTTETLSIRFTGTTTTEWRLDDIKLEGKVITMGTSSVKSSQNFIKNTSVSDEIYFSKNANVKIYNTNGQLVKTAKVTENGNLNVSALSAGVYIVEANVNGKPVQQKIIKK